MSVPSKTMIKNSRWNRRFLRHLSPEQKLQRKKELQRDRERHNKKKISKWRKTWLAKFRKKFLVESQSGTTPKKPLFRNPLNERAVYLYQNGHTLLAIAQMLNMSSGRVGKRWCVTSMGTIKVAAKSARPDDFHRLAISEAVSAK